MKYVNVIRRIIKIDEAINRAPCTARYDDIIDKLYDKRDDYVRSLRDYMKCNDRTNQELRKASHYHRKQVKLACKLLGVDYYKIIR